MPQPINSNIIFSDLSARFVGTSTITTSPAAGSETVIATLTIPSFGDISVVSGIRVQAFAAVTIGTNGVSANLRVRQTDVNGSVVQATGALTVTAGNLYAPSLLGFDATPGIKAYALTLTIGSGSATSTVSALHLSATIV